MQYKDAMGRLQTIVRRVEGSDVDVDELAAAVRDANKLIGLCREKLRSAEEEVGKALDDLRQTGAEPGEGFGTDDAKMVE